ncbi:hypothetical protein PN498_18225 [Oscillatoria sp. CS-180]|uniref:hypothetical protein n=1 Tax=Oscillatoria sp. CS-180 TaxID=3021720 RepID=UPI00232E4999|nr:hypothetical protein [Oscillatoria sp. CS-180]MDB9527936.1 hypothetical protein [Oscillatoria sp. CS-180]
MITTNTAPEMGRDRDQFNEPAFPFADHGEVMGSGLTKREIFAAMALQGALACDSSEGIWANARFAVRQADALITELIRCKPTDTDEEFD